MKQYLDLLQHVLDHGEERGDRTGTGTISVFGYQMRFNLQEGFPLVTTKKMGIKSVASELLWFLEGSTDERRLAEIYYGKNREDLIGKNTIWTANADNQGKALGYENSDLVKELGPCYGSQWRDWVTETGEVVDQIADVIASIKNNPNSRRHIVSAWNVGEIEAMSLPPCHTLFQFYVSNGKLSLQLYQRSADSLLGIPYNIASYALLLEMVAQVTGLESYEFVHTFGDLHIYKNHIDQVKLQLSRETHNLPKLVLNSEVDNIFEFTMDDIKIEGYTSHPPIKAEMAV